MAYFARRAAFFLLTLWAAITLNFVIPRLQPGDPARAMVARLTAQSETIDPAAVRAVELALGTPDGSLYDQYREYLGQVVRGDFGVSYAYFPYEVTRVIGDAMPWTIVLVGVTLIISFAVGTSLGAFAAWKRNGRLDAVVSLGSTFIGTLPYFWIALLLIYVFGFTLGWFPTGGGHSADVTPGWNAAFVADAAYHSILPAMSILVTGPAGWIMGMRNNMVATLGEDYTRLAKAKGLSDRRIALVYGARNAILPSVTGFATAMGAILGGTVLVESIFSYPGIGRLMFEAIAARDYPLMQALFLLTTVGVLIANLAADFLYGVLDPRVRREGAAR